MVFVHGEIYASIIHWLLLEIFFHVSVISSEEYISQYIYTSFTYLSTCYVQFIFPIGLLIVNDPPGLDYETQTTYTITITATDGGGLTAAAVTVLTIIDESEPPDITNVPASITLPEDSSAGGIVFTVAAVDPDADTIIFLMVSSPSDGKFLINGLSMISYFTILTKKSDFRSYLGLFFNHLLRKEYLDELEIVSV